jgi:hypothetical protein
MLKRTGTANADECVTTEWHLARAQKTREIIRQWLYVLLDVRRILPMVENGKSKKNRLRACRVVDVPLHEVSGICLRRGRTGRMSLIAVGDRPSKIAWFSLPRSDQGRIDWHTSDFAKLSGSMLPEDDPQIEAVCADGLGRILLLQETPPRVEFIDPEASKVIASIDLAVEGPGEIARAWSDPKGRGEKE